MEKASKLESLLGFALKSGKCRTGLNSVGTLKRVFLLIACKSASENSKKQSKSYANKFACPIYETVNKTLDELLHKENVKIVAITDSGFAKSIIDYKENELFEYKQENIE